MADRVVLHVGAMKSGTSYLQNRLFANRDRLAERGVHLPGSGWGDQVAAVREVLAPRTRGLGAQRWRRLVDEVAAAPGTCVVSMEFLGPARPVVVTEVGRAFGDAEVVVVLTVRDLNRSIAAMWQETIQNGRSWTWAEYLEAVRADRPGDGPGRTDRFSPGGTFWRQQNVAAIGRSWSRVVSPGRLVVVTVPPPGADRDTLWRRFAEAAGFDPRGLADVGGANESLGAASALALRRLNELLDQQGLAFPAGAALRKHRLAKSILATRRREEPAVGLPVSPWVADQADRLVTSLRGLDARLEGSWADLAPVPVPGVDPATVPEREVAEAALHGLAGIIVETVRSR